MQNTIHRKIKQLIPVNGWFAEHAGDNETFYIPIACLALCECIEEIYQPKDKKWHKADPYEEVCPMTGGGFDPIDFCQDHSNYKGIFLRLSTDKNKIVNTI